MAEIKETTTFEKKIKRKNIEDSIEKTGYYTIPEGTTCFLTIRFKDLEPSKHYPSFTTTRKILVGEPIKDENINSFSKSNPSYPLTTQTIKEEEKILEYLLQNISSYKLEITDTVAKIQEEKEICYKEFIENTESLKDRIDPSSIESISFNIPTEN